VGRAELKPGEHLPPLLLHQYLQFSTVRGVGAGDSCRRRCRNRCCSACQRFVHQRRSRAKYSNAFTFVVLGAKVIAAAGSEAKLDIAKRYGGADHIVDYSKPGWQKEVLKLTNGKGVDVIYDPVGLITGTFLALNPESNPANYFSFSADCLKCIAWKGRALVIGFAAGTIEKVPSCHVLKPPG
jgi:hypothetical protein